MRRLMRAPEVRMFTSVAPPWSWLKTHSSIAPPATPVLQAEAPKPSPDAIVVATWRRSVSPALHRCTVPPNPSFWYARCWPWKPGSVKLETKRVGTIAL
jgi:hypothetical protein